MIGVVVWSSAAKEKAVIWCEDHAALAYLQGRENLSAAGSWPEPGDLVELETDIEGALRHARRVTMLSEQEFAHLPRMLRASDPSAGPHLRLVSSGEAAEPRDEPGADCDVRIAAAG